MIRICIGWDIALGKFKQWSKSTLIPIRLMSDELDNVVDDSFVQRNLMLTALKRGE